MFSFNFKTFLAENKNVKYDYSSLQFDLPSEISKKIIKWGETHIKENELEGSGKENNIHLTILYGLHTSLAEEIENFLIGQRSFDIKLGKISVFSNETEDVLKIDVEKTDKLLKLHKLI